MTPPKVVRAVTLHQPWASAIALGLKRIETRSWPTAYRGWLAIHAGINRDIANELALEHMLARARVDLDAFVAAGYDSFNKLPFGRVVAVAELVDCSRVGDLLQEGVSEQDQRWGNFSLGRWGWVLDHVHRVIDGAEIRGRQGLWTLPGDYLLKIA